MTGGRVGIANILLYGLGCVSLKTGYVRESKVERK